MLRGFPPLDQKVSLMVQCYREVGDSVNIIATAVGWFVWLGYTLLEGFLFYLLWPGVSWLVSGLLGRALPAPTIPQAVACVLFFRIYVYDAFAKMAARQAERDRVQEIVLTPESEESEDSEEHLDGK